MTSEEQLPIRPGDLVAGKYRVEGVLGRGGMGIVVAATHEQLDQRVAIKFLLPEVNRPDLVQRFLREARASVKIQSEHIARVFDVGTVPELETPYMVMEFLHGEDLSQVLASCGPMPIEKMASYVLEAAEAVAEAHSHGIIHRDLKPANLFLANRTNGLPLIKVLDFGISKIPSSALGKDAAATATQAIMGSPQYMSPEQMVAAKSVDPRSDIWSFGIVMYELLTGAVPFAAETMPEMVAAILTLPPPALEIHRHDLPPALKAVILRCLEKEPAQRFANLAELGRALLPFAPSTSLVSQQRIEHLLGAPSDPIESSAPRSVASLALALHAPPTDLAIGSSTAFAGTMAPAETGVAATGATRSRSAWPVAVLTIVLAIVGAIAVLVLPKRDGVAREPPKPGASGQATADSAQAASASASALASSLASSAPATSLPTAPTASATASATAVASSVASSAVAPHANTPRPHASAAAASSATASGCHSEQVFDSSGEMHFKKVCP